MGPAAAAYVSPPFRAKHHQDALWAGLSSGTLQTTATDHCAFSTAEGCGLGDFTKIPNGTGGIEDRMSVLWHHGVGTGRLTPNEFVAVTSTNCAQIFNLYPRKGTVQAGPTPTSWSGTRRRRRRSRAKSQQSVIDYNVFEGIKVTGLAALSRCRAAR